MSIGYNYDNMSKISTLAQKFATRIRFERVKRNNTTSAVMWRK